MPSATDFSAIDSFTKVTDAESAFMARDIAKAEGLFVGYTSGATLQGVMQLADQGEFDENSYVVMIFSDHGSRYMSKIYNDAWMKEQGFTRPTSEQNQKEDINSLS